MMLRKLFAVGVIALILGLQLWVILPPGLGSWYWPFVTYPMYAGAKFPTDSVADFRLLARPCAPDTAAAVPLGAFDLGRTAYQLRDDLANVVGVSEATPLDTTQLAEQAAGLERMVVRVPGQWCDVQLWKRLYPNNGDVESALRSRWHLALRWPVGEGATSSGWTQRDRLRPRANPIASLPPLTSSFAERSRR